MQFTEETLMMYKMLRHWIITCLVPNVDINFNSQPSWKTAQQVK